MSHMVIYRGADGKPGYHQTDEILDAVDFVERLRNEQAVEHARIFRLEEVQFEFRPYYRVELTSGSSGPTLGTAERRFVAAAEPEPELEPAVEAGPSWASPVGSDPVAEASHLPAPEASPDEASVGARRGLFGR